jgi:WD40 repeat protein
MEGLTGGILMPCRVAPCLIVFLLTATPWLTAQVANGRFEDSGEEPAVDALPPGAFARLGSTRFRISSTVRTLAFSPDGKTLFIAPIDQPFGAWDVASGKPLRLLRARNNGPGGFFFGVIAVSPDGRLVVEGNAPSARVWDAATGAVLFTLRGDPSTGSAVAISPDGKTVATAGEDRRVRLWDAGTGKSVAVLTAHTAAIGSVAFSPDGLTIASASEDQTIRVWSLADRKEVAKLSGHRWRTNPVAFSPDGRLIASGDEKGRLVLREVATGREIAVSRDDQLHVESLAFGPDGRIATGGRDRTVYVRDTNGAELRRWRAGPGSVTAVAFSPDGNTVAAASRGDGAIRLWDADIGRELPATLGHSAAVQDVRFRADGETVVSAGADGRLIRWRLFPGRATTAYVATSIENRSVSAVSPDGTRVAVGQRTREPVVVWDSATGRSVPLGEPGPVGAVAFAPDGRTLATGGIRLRFWDAATGREKGQLNPANRAAALAYSADGRLLAAATPDARIVWEVDTGKIERSFRYASDRTASLALSPDGRLLAAGGDDSSDGTVRVWDVVDGAIKSDIGGDGFMSDRLAFSPDGRLLAGAGAGVRLWELATGQEVARYAGHHGDIAVLAFSPDGRSLATGGDDGTLLLWDVTGLRIAGHRKRPPTDAELQSRWADLALSASEAIPAVWALAASPERSVPLIRRELFRAAPSDETVAALIAELDAATFAQRERAAVELRSYGAFVEPALKQALRHERTPELHRRLERLLGEVTGPGMRARPARAVQVLVYANTAAASALLKELAAGPSDTPLTGEAKAALGRLAR